MVQMLLGGVINIITKNAHKPLEAGVGYLYENRGNHKTNISLGAKKTGEVYVCQGIITI